MNGNIRVVECMPDAPGFHEFTSLMTHVYTREQLKVFPRAPIETKGLVKCIVVMNDGLPAARAALYHNQFISYHIRRSLIIGYFESIDDPSLARVLFDAIKRFAKKNQYDVLIGPMNGTTWNDYRVNLPPIQAPFFSENFHPAYYADLFFANGFGVLHRYVSSVAPLGIRPESTEIEAYFGEQGLKLRSINLDRFEEELALLFPLCDSAFSKNPFFSPISENDFIRKYVSLKNYLDPEFILLAQNSGGVEGLMFCFPDPYHPKQLIIKTVAKTDRAPRGLITMMTKSIYQTAVARNYETIIHAYMHESNPSIRLSHLFSGKLYQEHALLFHSLT